jgi:RNA polymerase sigma-70 factor (ECF subfamily)
MHTTSYSLLERLREPEASAAWDRFVALYTPLLMAWSRRLGMTQEAAGDFVQDVFLTLVQQMPRFEHDGKHKFRAWLKTIAMNRWRNQQQKMKPETVGELEVSVPDDAIEFVESNYREILSRRALEIMRSDFQETTWRACWETVVVGRPAEEVATELGMTVGAVYVAKSRVLARLREELAGLLDE